MWNEDFRVISCACAIVPLRKLASLLMRWCLQSFYSAFIPVFHTNQAAELAWLTPSFPMFSLVVTEKQEGYLRNIMTLLSLRLPFSPQHFSFLRASFRLSEPGAQTVPPGGRWREPPPEQRLTGDEERSQPSPFLLPSPGLLVDKDTKFRGPQTQ